MKLYRIDETKTIGADDAYTSGRGTIPGGALVEVGDVPEDRLNEWHTVYVGDVRWRLAHPLCCDLSDCDFDRQAENWGHAPGDVGTYRWGPKLSDWEAATFENTE